jgi:hypothetical protein
MKNKLRATLGDNVPHGTGIANVTLHVVDSFTESQLFK